MTAPDRNNVTRKDTLEQVEKTKGRAPQELIDYRRCMTDINNLKIWRLFWDIRYGVAYNTPIPMTELKAYFELTRENYFPRLIRLLRMMDKTYIIKVQHG